MNIAMTLLDAHLLGLGTHVPPHELPQDMVKLVAKRVLGERYSDFERLTKSFENAGINSRYSAVIVTTHGESRTRKSGEGYDP
tara:strand:- start:1810 stop:2058 length:249 start_codon:yes stop_codon:yes gene_type:complete